MGSGRRAARAYWATGAGHDLYVRDYSIDAVGALLKTQLLAVLRASSR